MSRSERVGWNLSRGAQRWNGIWHTQEVLERLSVRYTMEEVAFQERLDPVAAKAQSSRMISRQAGHLYQTYRTHRFSLHLNGR